MLTVTAGLMLAWFFKALSVKDSLLGAVLEHRNGGGSTAQSEYGPLPGEGGESDEGDVVRPRAADVRIRRLAMGVLEFLGGQSPVFRMLGEESGRKAAMAGDAWGAEENSMRIGGKSHMWAAVYTFLAARSPLLRFLAGENDTSVISRFDPDPSYAAYLTRQKLKNEPWYLVLYGKAGKTADNRAGDVDGSETQEEIRGRSGADITQDPSQVLALQDAAVRQLSGLTPAYHRRDGLSITGTAYVLEQLLDYDFLMQNFYSVHASTTAGREEINAAVLLGRDLSIEKSNDGPQILIYHTHSQEEYCDFGPENPQATVVGIGNRLTQLLEEKGYEVIHDTTPYDIMNGELDRNHAYNYALDGITAILQRYPSIQVVLDLHRDGVGKDVRLVTEIDGQPTARIMFFNGMSQTPDGPIEYLPNPYREENLAFSLQMQLDAAAYFPGFTRKIYLKGLRYNLHVRPRSALIEVGAQTNTYEEALNAMEPLAELLDMTLGG